ncbi:hypothetical protein H696_03462 [Fonticula alba]|uniref:rRNA biogenesis protein RRP36 n=1 Tax=Fonticula alba TaxID=691883 RepID=A0A058Z928_FONAL|nr:hypothetical protein H696_03462 [Fonticula alba]KCV69997.1 hypothetical protein H696_03462 [Fonticula alba]|eukprot:XP_009495603.1 hypothetical protein H696_03462 [Fonticula alba]
MPPRHIAKKPRTEGPGSTGQQPEDERLLRRMMAFDQGSNSELSSSDDDDNAPEERAPGPDSRHGHLDTSSEYDSDDSDDDSESEYESGDEFDVAAASIDEKIASLQRDLSDIPLSELMELRRTAGAKAVSRLRIASQGGEASLSRGQADSDVPAGKRKKSQPQVQSSRVRVSVLRQVVESQRPKARDPRFERTAGKYNEDLFKKAYGFITDQRQQEIDKLRASINREKNEGRREGLKMSLQRLTQIQKRIKDDDKKQAVRSERLSKERELVRQGKKPYFLKKSDERKIATAARFKALSESGGAGAVQKVLERRRQKQAAKDRRFLPHVRRSAAQQDDD